MFSAILCFVRTKKCQPRPRPWQMWEQERVAHFVSTQEFRELNDIAGRPLVFGCWIYPAHTALQLLESRRWWTTTKCTRSTSRIGTSLCRCKATWTETSASMMYANKIQRTYLLVLSLSWQGGGPFADVEMNKNGAGPPSYKPEGKWNSTAEVIMKTFLQEADTQYSGAEAHYPKVLLWRTEGGGRSFTHYHVRVQKQQNYCRVSNSRTEQLCAARTGTSAHK